MNGRESTLQTILKNGDMVKIINSKKVSPSLALAFIHLKQVKQEHLLEGIGKTNYLDPR